MNNDLMRQLFPPPETKTEAVSYLARLDQIVAEWSDEDGSARTLDILRRWRWAVEQTYRLLPD